MNKKKIFEDASAGSVGASSIAGNRGYSIFGQRTKPMRREIDPANIPVIKFKHDNRRWLTKFRRAPAFSFMQYLGSTVQENFNLSDALAKPNNATGQAKTSEDKNNAVRFGLEDDKGNIIKVFVDVNDADHFEDALSRELEDGMKKVEIAELLFKLRDEFNIINVVWPKIVDDVVEEEETQLPQDKQGGTDADTDLASDFETGGDEGLGGEDTDKENNPDETSPHEAGPNDVPVDDLGTKDDFSAGDEKETLSAILSMLAADAEAKKADADARAAEARAKEAEAMARTAEARIKSEEQILDMEAYNKQKSNEKSEVRKLAKLAQYRHDVKRDTEQTQLSRDSDVVDIDTNNKQVAGAEEEENSTPISVNTLMKIIRKMQARENAQE